MTRLAVNCFSMLTVGLLLFSAPAWAQQGDPLRGEALFVGTVSFAEGGAPCLACHAIGGHDLGQAAGASYGPDLTALFTDYGEDGVAGILEDPAAFESMQAIFAEHPLSDQERADLSAFFASVAESEKTDIGARLTGHVVLATVIFLVLIGAFGWRRLQGVRKPLVEKARYGKGGIA